MFSFNRSYISVLVFLLLALTGTDLFITHPFLQATLSNIILIVMQYAAIKAFWNVKPVVAGAALLLLSSAYEIAPFISFADPSQQGSLITISPTIGFWYTAMTYTTGIALALLTERAILQASKKLHID
ncbi:hypothetical protein [Cesiribacter sp. SM1]|uniref:hypothetical protein n=1 Tax=Cesiribacter sp. SM1 TaxID=2861196 RepID=UPI001CD7F857|nr:hypothetical protein [Cesiribacter sp. SM1]